jgi:glycosyltransferase involved in cell wall biosynthesis
MAVVAIDARKYFDFGIGTYIQQLVHTLSTLPSNHEFQLYVRGEDANVLSVPDGWKTVPVDYRKYSVGEIGLLGLSARVHGVQVFHEPHYTLPLWLKGRSVVTIHDIIHLRFPQYFSKVQRAYSHSMIWHALRNAAYVITDSEFTKRDILTTFRVPEQKIRVIPLGVGNHYNPVPRGKRMEAFRTKFGIRGAFVLYVGNIKPHKGVPTLLESFKMLRRHKDLELVLVGGTLDQDPVIARQVLDSGLMGRIKELGRLTEDDLVTAYSAAEILVMPSLYEGFGLPALEAMACGTPVIVSDAASLPEIAGDAALQFRAGNSPELADLLASLLREPALRKKCVRKGIERAKTFTWTKTAMDTLALYDTIALG